MVSVRSTVIDPVGAELPPPVIGGVGVADAEVSIGEAAGVGVSGGAVQQSAGVRVVETSPVAGTAVGETPTQPEATRQSAATSSLILVLDVAILVWICIASPFVWCHPAAGHVTARC